MRLRTPLNAIQMNCISCMGGSPTEVPLCHILDCEVWPYRLGVRPTSPEYQRRIKAAWESRPEQRSYATKELGQTIADYLPFTLKKGKKPVGGFKSKAPLQE